VILLNGETRDDLAGGLTVSELLDALEMPHRDRGVAVAIDATVVPRSAWDDQRIADGARVEVLVAVQGG
jgi:sulfur carrier protein